MLENTCECIKAFFSKVMNDADLQGQLKAIATLPELDALAGIVKIANGAGYNFTVADLTEFSKTETNQLTIIEDGELSNQQLEAVVGGSLFGIGCWSKANHICYLGYFGDDDGCSLCMLCMKKTDWA